jgi:hypothetical protein
VRAHRSLQPADVIKYGPSRIALMVASEFWRAAGGAKYRADVVACYGRARELMGILETVPFNEQVAAMLQPYYRKCIEKDLLRESRMSPKAVESFSREVAEAFERASDEMGEGDA